MIKDGGLKIGIFSSGTRGDVQPYIALGLSLQARGHEVFIATEERMAPLVREFQLPYRRIVGDPTGLIYEPSAQEVLQKGSMFKLISLTAEWDKKFDKNEILESYERAAEDADLIISAGLTLTQTYCVAEKFGCVWVPMVLGPTLPTREYPLWALSSLICCFSCLNKWTYSVAFTALWSSESKFINPWRERMGLPPITHKDGIVSLMNVYRPPVLIACSEIICGPLGRVPADYPPYAHVSGFIFVPSTGDAGIDPSLLDFMNKDPLNINPSASGRPIIYLGFGSMPAPNPEELVRMAIQVCNLCRCRAVMVAGWSDLSGGVCGELLAEAASTSTIFVTKAVPHDWLFPKMACIVHHCGVFNISS